MIEEVTRVAKCATCGQVREAGPPPGPLCGECLEKHYGPILRRREEQWCEVVTVHANLIRQLAVSAGYPFLPPSLDLPVTMIVEQLEAGKLIGPTQIREDVFADQRLRRD